ncbi:ubiquilin-1-like [Dromaius novaehollandiae]|uniref:ubiquilin-1-like n=1 Tax=Dromaius novaehollandiae TaxID=8790 RepID=UPI00311DBCA2
MSESKEAAGSSQPVVTMDSSNIIKVTVKTLKQKEQFEVAQSSTIQEFKEEVSKRFKTPPELLALIFAGKILKDQDTLSQYGIHSGVSIHLVIRSQKRPQDSLADQCTATTLMRSPSHNLDLNTINNNLFLLGFLIGVTGINLIGLDSTDVSDLVSRVQERDVSLHGLVSEIMQSSSVQHIFANAELARDFIMSNPQVQQLVEQNPEIGHILTNPHFIREILEASSSPAMMQEMIRNHDRALNNLESIPGGYSALEQLYRETEEPMLEAVQTQLGNNPFASLDSNSSLNRARLPACTENRRPLPNPWAPQSNRASDNGNDYDGHNAYNSADDSFIVLNLGPAAGAVVPSSGGIQSMVQQLTENSELMYNLENALTNPQGPAQMLLNNTHILSDGNSQLQDERTQELPAEMENTEISSLLRNPRALQALLQVQLGLQTLSTEVPDFILGLGDPDVELDLESMEDSAKSSESEEDASLVSDKDEAESQEEMDEQAPQTRFGRQMQQLSAMGFQDQNANLQALIDTEGEVNAAVEILTKTQSSNEVP